MHTGCRSRYENTVADNTHTRSKDSVDTAHGMLVRHISNDHVSDCAGGVAGDGEELNLSFGPMPKAGDDSGKEGREALIELN